MATAKKKIAPKKTVPKKAVAKTGASVGMNADERREYQLCYRLAQVAEIGWDTVNKAKQGHKASLDAIELYATEGHRKSAVLAWVAKMRLQKSK